MQLKPKCKFISAHAFYHFWVTKLPFYSQLCDGNLDIPEPKSADEVALLYFEAFNIQPVKLNLSFVRTQGVNIVDERASGDSAIMFMINVLTMAIGNINVRNINILKC